MIQSQLFATLLLLIFLVDVSSFDHPRVQCLTTKGPLIIEVYRDWAPLGADRFLDLVKDDFYTNIALFRCVKRFLTQFGITEDPSKKHWHRKEIPDDPNLNLGIKKNYVSYAGGGPNTRSTQLFIAFEDLDFLGKEPWETPFGQVIEGQSTLDALYKDYGDIPPFGKGPDQQKLHNQGNAYIRQNFPKVDFIQSCHILEPSTAAPVLENPSLAQRDTVVENQHRGVAEEEAGVRAEGIDGHAPPGSDNDNDAAEPAYVMGDDDKKEEIKSERQGGLRAGAASVPEARAARIIGVLDGNAASVHIVGKEGEIIFKALFFLVLVFAVLFFYMKYFSVSFGGKRSN